MRHFLLILFLLIASSFNYYDPATEVHTCVSYEATQCNEGRMLLCPPGYIDGCLNETTANHRCVLKHDAPSCDLKMKINCPVNFHDGCDTGETETHECVADEGPACAEDVEFMCPSGFKDACRI